MNEHLLKVGVADCLSAVTAVQCSKDDRRQGSRMKEDALCSVRALITTTCQVATRLDGPSDRVRVPVRSSKSSFAGVLHVCLAEQCEPYSRCVEYSADSCNNNHSLQFVSLLYAAVLHTQVCADLRGETAAFLPISIWSVIFG